MGLELKVTSHRIVGWAYYGPQKCRGRSQEKNMRFGWMQETRVDDTSTDTLRKKDSSAGHRVFLFW